MIRFLHSADWQLGARFRQFGDKGDTLRAARLKTLKRSLELARSREVDAFLIAGDLFEDNQVDDALVNATIQHFAAFPDVRVFILPGNHDPASGPEAVWMRRAFTEAPGHIRVLTEPAAVDLGGAWLLASPLTQKLSTTDPSRKLVELAAAAPAGAIKIGLTHGALAIEARHQPNDFPIALNAASRANLDYLAIGHWHNSLVDTDGGRIVMPGTPEPDQFDQDRAGCVALVEIDAAGSVPRVDLVPVATLSWRSYNFDFLSPGASAAALQSEISNWAERAAQTVLRVTLSGSASPAQLAGARAQVETMLAPFLVGQLRDNSTVALSEAELADLRFRHPILAQVLTDLAQLGTLATGRASAAAGDPGSSSPLTLAEAQEILSGAKIDLARLSAEHLEFSRQLLLQTMQEVNP